MAPKRGCAGGGAKRPPGEEQKPQSKKAKVKASRPESESLGGTQDDTDALLRTILDAITIQALDGFTVSTTLRLQDKASAVNFVREFLSFREATLQQNIQDRAARVDAAKSELQSQEGTRVEVCNAFAARQKKLESVKTDFCRDNSELRVARALLNEAVAAQLRHDGSAHKAAALREALHLGLREHLAPLLQGCQLSRAERHLQALEDLAKLASLDDGLVGASRVAASKMPEERSDFQAMVLQQLQSQLEGKAAEMEVLAALEISAAAAAASEERSRAASAAQVVFDTCRERQASSAAAFRRADSDHRGAQATLAGVDCSLRDMQDVIAVLEACEVGAQLAAERFQHGPRAAFDVLIARFSAAGQKGPQAQEVSTVAPGQASKTPKLWWMEAVDKLRAEMLVRSARTLKLPALQTSGKGSCSEPAQVVIPRDGEARDLERHLEFKEGCPLHTAQQALNAGA